MKIQASLTIKWIYQVNPKNYPANSTKHDILRIDKEGIETNPEEFIDLREDVDADLEIIEE
jgi:hypothetical protein